MSSGVSFGKRLTNVVTAIPKTRWRGTIAIAVIVATAVVAVWGAFQELRLAAVVVAGIVAFGAFLRWIAHLYRGNKIWEALDFFGKGLAFVGALLAAVKLFVEWNILR